MTEVEVVISPITEEDYDQWLNHWKGYQIFYEADLSDAITKTTWNRFFDPSVPVNCAVARKGSEIVGFVHFLFHLSTWSIGDYCYLEDLYVDPNYRGKHVGKQLIEYVQGQAREKKSTRLYWHTQETNKRAHRLYDWVGEKPGFIEYRKPL